MLDFRERQFAVAGQHVAVGCGVYAVWLSLEQIDFQQFLQLAH